jgi:3-oxoacyl-[acyl-carrier protein] reductase
MDLRIQGHVALVQGASKGIGRGIAESLAAEGVQLLLTGRTELALRETAGEIAGRYGVRVEYCVADSGELGSIPTVMEHVREAFGRLDILVCNSGGPKPGEFDVLTPTDWAAAAELLLTGPVEYLKAGLPLLEKSSAPRMFMVTSSTTVEPAPGLTLSNVMRPGVVGLVKNLAQFYARMGLRVHSLAPGRVETDRLAAVFTAQAAKRGIAKEAVAEQALASIPVGRFGKPGDLGSLAAFLSSPQADYLTGQNWLVDGGFVKAL